MKNTKTFASVFIFTLVLSLIIFMADRPSASASIIFLGRGKNLDMELSPPKRLFHPYEDRYFYPGSPKITKNLEVVNVGDVLFRICRFNATFSNDKELANGLQIEILELGTGKGEKHLLYNGTLNDLSEGVEVNGKKTVPQGKSVTVQISVWMPETAGNEYQGLSMTADIAITVHSLPARSIKEEALSELEAAKNLTTNEHTLKEIDKAIEHIQKSLNIDPKHPDETWKKHQLWVDDNHLDPKHGEKVFDEEKKAVKDLMKLIKDKKTPDEIKDELLKIINKLLTADDLLAHTAYDEAQEYAGDPKVDKELEKCNKEFEKAKKELGHTKKDGTPDPKYDKAIDHFKKAWKHAQHAIKKAG